MENLTELSYDAADKVEMLAGSLHERIQEEIEKILISQLKKLGFVSKKAINELHNIGVKRILYPDDPHTLCVYEYDGKTILAARLDPETTFPVFDVPNLETQNQEREVQP